MSPAIVVALVLVLPAAMLVAYFFGREQARQYLVAATAVQAIVERTVAAMQSEEATIKALERMQTTVTNQGKMLGQMNTTLAEYTAEVTQAKSMLPSAIRATRVPRQIGEDST